MVGNANISVQVHANDWYQILLWKQVLTGEGAGREVTTRARTLSKAAENQGREKGQYLKTSGPCFLSTLLFSLHTVLRAQRGTKWVSSWPQEKLSVSQRGSPKTQHPNHPEGLVKPADSHALHASPPTPTPPPPTHLSRLWGWTREFSRKQVPRRPEVNSKVWELCSRGQIRSGGHWWTLTSERPWGKLLREKPFYSFYNSSLSLS